MTPSGDVQALLAVLDVATAPRTFAALVVEALRGEEVDLDAEGLLPEDFDPGTFRPMLPRPRDG